MPDTNTMPSWPGWKTVRPIGRGSFGAVYEIERDVFGEKEKAALKVISIPQSESEINALYDDGYDKASVTSTFNEYLKSIVGEYSLMRKMNGSSNVVNCDDVRYIRHDDGLGWDIFIKMELLTPLTKSLGKTVSEKQVVQIGADICKALILCKKHNIIHRDIKPGNIFTSENGDYKLGDFGIARVLEGTRASSMGIGTLDYMAPEVLRESYDSTVDIYSLGMVLYWLLNGRRTPFLPQPPTLPSSAAKEQARKRRFSGEALPPPAHGSEGLKRIVLKACAYAPVNRYQSAEEMLRDLESLGRRKAYGGQPGPKPARPPVETENTDPGRTINVLSDSAQQEQRPPTVYTQGAFDHRQERSKPEKPKKKALFGILAAAALFLIAMFLKTGFAQTEKPIASGKYGDNGTWTLSTGGVLTISCSGPMENGYNREGSVYSSEDTPWSCQRDRIITVILKPGVTRIGYFAFYNCANLTSISIPNSVTSIGPNAFTGCSSLESVTIPDTVTNMGMSTFINCTSLKSVIIPEGVPNIGGCTFMGCSSLESVTIPDSVTSIDWCAFDNCTSLKDVYYSGSRTQWAAIEIEFDNDPLTSAAIHYNS